MRRGNGFFLSLSQCDRGRGVKDAKEEYGVGLLAALPEILEKLEEQAAAREEALSRACQAADVTRATWSEQWDHLLNELNTQRAGLEGLGAAGGQLSQDAERVASAASAAL